MCEKTSVPGKDAKRRPFVLVIRSTPQGTVTLSPVSVFRLYLMMERCERGTSDGTYIRICH